MSICEARPPELHAHAWREYCYKSTPDISFLFLGCTALWASHPSEPWCLWSSSLMWSLRVQSFRYDYRNVLKQLLFRSKTRGCCASAELWYPDAHSQHAPYPAAGHSSSSSQPLGSTISPLQTSESSLHRSFKGCHCRFPAFKERLVRFTAKLHYRCPLAMLCHHAAHVSL